MHLCFASNIKTFLQVLETPAFGCVAFVAKSAIPTNCVLKLVFKYASFDLLCRTPRISGASFASLDTLSNTTTCKFDGIGVKSRIRIGFLLFWEIFNARSFPRGDFRLTQRPSASFRRIQVVATLALCWHFLKRYRSSRIDRMLRYVAPTTGMIYLLQPSQF